MLSLSPFRASVTTVKHLLALTPVAPWSRGVLVLSSHTDSVLLGLDTDLIIGFLNDVILKKKIKK